MFGEMSIGDVVVVVVLYVIDVGIEVIKLWYMW